MKKKQSNIILIFLLVLLAIFIIFRKDNKYKKFAGTWEITKSKTDKNFEKKSKLELSNNFEFSLFLPDSTVKTGVWKIQKDSFLLTYDYSFLLDSILIEKKFDYPSINFFSDNEKIFSVNYLSRVNINKKIIQSFAFKIKNSKLSFKNSENHIQFLKISNSHKKQLIEKKSNFSVKSLLRGLLGIIVLIGIAFLFSSKRKAVSFRTIGIGLSIQLVLALGVLYIPFVQTFFETIGKIFVKILDFTRDGSIFLFGNTLLDIESFEYIFVFQILPTIIFFSALTSVLFYLGIIQKVVKGLAWLLSKALKISGAESLSVAGNIFLGQTESPLMIKAYLPKMNKSEILLVMIGGMATVAGGVLAAYVGFLGGNDPVLRLMYAKHLLTASIMAAPGAIVIAKILYPQTEKIKEELKVESESIGSNFLDALSKGTTEGLKLAVNVGAMLLVFFALIAFMNYIFNYIGDISNLNEHILSFTDGKYNSLSIQFILGYTLSPLMWLIGVNSADITLVGQLLGEKLVASEFVAYISLAEFKSAGDSVLGAFAEQKSIIMATYMLCGFANFASIGIQIGGIGSLAPSKRVQLSKFGMKALLGGTLASLLSATVIGMILG